MRAELTRHFDVVVVVWVLALFVAWSVITLSRATLTNATWDQAPQAGPAWVVPAGVAGN
jgi:hypothetical protein